MTNGFSEPAAGEPQHSWPSLIDQTDQNSRLLESDANGPPIRDEDPGGMPPGDIFHLWPTSWISAVRQDPPLFSRYPIFGLAHNPETETVSDFGKHIQALAVLLSRSNDTSYAMTRILKYKQNAE